MHDGRPPMSLEPGDIFRNDGVLGFCRQTGYRMKTQHLVISLLIVLEVSGAAVLSGCGDHSAPSAPTVNSSTPLGITIRPYTRTVQSGALQQFGAIVSAPVGFNSSGISQTVIWSVAGPGCSDASCGIIDATGKYTAPATVPDPPTVMVTAKSVVAMSFATMTMVIVAVAGECCSFSVNPSGIAFGDQLVNTTSAPKAVTVTNTGNVPQPVLARINGSPGIWEDFTQTNDCASKIAVGASCTFYITFRPGATGNRSATVFFDGYFDEQGAANLSGTGTK